MSITRRAALTAAAAAPWIGRAQAATTLEFTSWQAEEPGFGAWWKEVIAAFEAATPGTRVAMTQIPFGSYLDQLTIRFASNRPPPLLELPSDSFGAFAGQGWLADLDARIKGTAVADGWSALQADMQWDGQTQGVLLMGYAFMLFYNQALLTAAGVALPTSWDEFCAAVPKLTQRDRGIFGLSAVTTEYPTIPQDFIRTIVWSGGSLLQNGRYALTDARVVQAAETYRRVVGGNAPLGDNSTIIRQLFVDGKTAFLLDGPWVWSLLEKAQADVRPNLKMARAPFSPPLGGASNSIHIAAGLDPATADAAWSFIAFLTQAKWQSRYTELSSAPAARRDALSPELAARRPELALINQAVIGTQSTTPANQVLRASYTDFNHILQRASMRVISTTVPVAQIMAETQAELERSVPLG